MQNKTIAPYGSWKSPFSAEMIADKSIRINHITSDNGNLYWLESRPYEKGRSVIIKHNNNQTTEITPLTKSPSSKVHEYGGGEFCVKDDIVYFVNKEDQEVYKIDTTKNNTPIALTKSFGYRYADLEYSKEQNLIFAVCEIHDKNLTEPENCIVCIDCSKEKQTPVKIIFGNDFYMSPKISPCNKKLSWVEWKHPNMPWDNTKLYVGEINKDGSIKNKKLIAGSEKSSIVQPKWDNLGNLYFVDDKTGWWNIYKYDMEGKYTNILSKEAEFCLPAWVFGQSTYDFDNYGNIIASFKQNGLSKIACINTKDKITTYPETDFSYIDKLITIGNDIFVIAGSTTMSLSIIKFNLSEMSMHVIKEQSPLEVDEEYISLPQQIKYKNSKNEDCFAFLYLPTNKDFDAKDEDLPPLLVKSHGGPTGSTEAIYSPKIQYWTSRGFAVLDVNYGGSTGYGTEYRKRLDGNWGVVDMNDCVAGVNYLIENEIIDPDKICISGGSAGGYTTLCALTFTNIFKAGASYYGVSDLASLMADTHKFESRYNINLVGENDIEKTMYDRSPINFAEQLSCPVIFFQGMQDFVVPPSQAEQMVNVLKEKGIKVDYITYEEEGHGFRNSFAISDSIDKEFSFYKEVLGL